MNDLVDVRTPLAVSPTARVEIGRDGILHVLAGPITLHLEREACEELTTTLARAMMVLARAAPKKRRPPLAVVRVDGADVPSSRGEADGDPVRRV